MLFYIIYTPVFHYIPINIKYFKVGQRQSTGTYLLKEILQIFNKTSFLRYV